MGLGWRKTCYWVFICTVRIFRLISYTFATIMSNSVKRAIRNGSRIPYKVLGLMILIPAFSMYLGYVLLDLILGPPRLLPDSGVIADLAKLNYSLLNKQYLTVQLTGQLGNMMFQYAAMYGLSRANGMIPLIPQFNPLSEVFPRLKARRAKGKEVGRRWLKYRELKPGMYDQKSFTLNFHHNLSMEGYFQSWRYFEHAQRELKQQYQFSNVVNREVRTYLQNVDSTIRSSANNLAPRPMTFVGIHVRRGDLLDEYNVKRGYNVATDTYLTKAMFYYRAKFKHENVVFVVCSDDKKWCMENVSPPEGTHMVISPFKRAELDLAVLAACNHTIMTVGSFGWWAGYLAGGSVVYYNNYATHGSDIHNDYRSFDYFYSHWTPM